jgi:transposase-like protein
MTSKRKRYTAEFKAKVALEAPRGELTTAQLATKHGIHHRMMSDWKLTHERSRSGPWRRGAPECRARRMVGRVLSQGQSSYRSARVGGNSAGPFTRFDARVWKIPTVLRWNAREHPAR